MVQTRSRSFSPPLTGLKLLNGGARPGAQNESPREAKAWGPPAVHAPRGCLPEGSLSCSSSTSLEARKILDRGS